MDLKLNETSEIWGSSESDYKFEIFFDLMSRNHFTTLMMEAAGTSEAFVHFYQCTCNCQPWDKILHWKGWL